MLQTTRETKNNSSGNGQFGTLLRKRTNKNSGADNENIKYIGKKDKRMRFNNSKDPIYYVFDVIENRPVSTLAKEFIKDSFFDAINFVSRVVG